MEEKAAGSGLKMDNVFTMLRSARAGDATAYLPLRHSRARQCAVPLEDLAIAACNASLHRIHPARCMMTAEATWRRATGAR